MLSCCWLIVACSSHQLSSLPVWRGVLWSCMGLESASCIPALSETISSAHARHGQPERHNLYAPCPPAGSGSGSSGSLRDMLQEKCVRHDILLAAYKTGGVMQQLPPRQARAVFEHAEMLAAAEAVLDWQRSSEADANAGDTVTGGEPLPSPINFWLGQCMYQLLLQPQASAVLVAPGNSQFSCRYRSWHVAAPPARPAAITLRLDVRGSCTSLHPQTANQCTNKERNWQSALSLCSVCRPDRRGSSSD